MSLTLDQVKEIQMANTILSVILLLYQQVLRLIARVYYVFGCHTHSWGIDFMRAQGYLLLAIHCQVNKLASKITFE